MTFEGPKKTVWTDNYNIHSWEADLNGYATLPALCNYMQESAWKHAENLHLGFSHLIEKNLVWVLSRNMVQINRFPKWGDRIKIETWPTGIDRLFFFRDFQLSDESGDVFGLGTTTWFVIDVNSRRPQKPDKFLGLRISEHKPAIPNHAPKLNGLVKADKSKNTSATYFDMDVNGHVTNIRYIEWILESYDFVFLKKNTLKSFAINHLAEAQSDDKLVVNSQKTGDGLFNHSITFAETGKELCRAQIQWEV